MYKAIKDNKIIAVNDLGKFPCLIYDEAKEDTEHQVSDYEHYKGEFLLKEDVPAPSDEEIRQLRANAYALEVDNITAHIQRLRDEEQTEEIITKINELIVERSQKVLEIQERFPYPIDNLENIE